VLHSKTLRHWRATFVLNGMPHRGTISLQPVHRVRYASANAKPRAQPSDLSIQRCYICTASQCMNHGWVVSYIIKNPQMCFVYIL